MIKYIEIDNDITEANQWEGHTSVHFKAQHLSLILIHTSPDTLSRCLEVCAVHQEAFRQLVLSVSVVPYHGNFSSQRQSLLPHVSCQVDGRTLPGTETYTVLTTEQQVV